MTRLLAAFAAASAHSCAGAVGEALAVVEAGDRVGGREHGRAALLLGAHLGFVLEVDVAAPAEQDQRDVERQRRARDADFGPEVCPPMRRWWKKALPFQISSITAVISTASTSASRRALAAAKLALLVTTGTAHSPRPHAYRGNA